MSGSKSPILAGKEVWEQCLTCAEGSSHSFLLKSADSRGEIQLVNRLGFILITEKAWEMGEFLSSCSLRFKTRTLIVHLHCLLLSGRFLRGKIQAPINGWLGSWQRSSCCVSSYRAAPGSWASTLRSARAVGGESTWAPHQPSSSQSFPRFQHRTTTSSSKSLKVKTLIRNWTYSSFASKNREGREMYAPYTADTLVFPKMCKILIFDSIYYCQCKHTALVFLV